MPNVRRAELTAATRGRTALLAALLWTVLVAALGGWISDLGLSSYREQTLAGADACASSSRFSARARSSWPLLRPSSCA